MLFRMFDRRLFTFCLYALFSISRVFASPVQFKGDTQQFTTTGYSMLKWELVSEPILSEPKFILQQSHDSLFSTYKTLYEGPDLASFVSGLPDGIYFYRVVITSENQQNTQWSESIRVEVKHHSRKMALSLFITGIIIFLATTGVIVVGNLKYNKA